MPNTYAALETKKFLDANGLAHFAQRLNQYPTNDVIAAVVDGVQDALDEKLDIADVGKANGAASLGQDGKVPSSQLPSYVDDVLEFQSRDGFPSTGETGKIYVDLATNKTYRWGGSAYVEISPSLALGTTSGTAFRGDYGNSAYQHSQAKGNAYPVGLYKITTNSEGHVANATPVAKSDITALGIPAQDTTYGTATQSANGLMSSSDKTKLDGIATGATANVGTITGITMNGASKGTSGVVNLGTVLTAHQDISGKADKSATVSNVAYDSTNKKITQKINGTISDVVTVATLKAAMALTKSDVGLSNVDNKSSATIRGELTSSNVTTALGYTPGKGTVMSVKTGPGLTGGTITSSGTIRANLRTESYAAYDTNTITNTSGRQYAVVQDYSGYLSVNVPWVNTTYTNATQAKSGLMSASDKTKLDEMVPITNEQIDALFS